MFGTLLKPFVSNNNAEAAPESEQHNPNFITEPGRIISVVQQIIESPPLCTIILPHNKQTFFTSVLEINKASKRFVFDQANPATGNRLLQQINGAKLTTFIHGIHLTFGLSDIKQENYFERPVFSARLPDSIYYPQRRSSPRIEVEPHTIGFQGLSRNSGLLVKGHVLDISRTGLCVTFLNNGSATLNGDKFTNCLIRFPDDNNFSFDLSVRSVRRNNQNYAYKQIGGFFTHLPIPVQNKLNRTLCALERQQIRKRKN
jgi:c-di-GMP-binding flagellar brake protein YcgR